MKLAILGSSAIALEAALRFHSHGAALTWFHDEEEEVETLFRSSFLFWEDCTSGPGWDLLGKRAAGQFTWGQWKVQYYLPLVEILKTEQSLKPYRVLSVTKRFLAPEEEVPGKSRFQDLFRLIYQLNPEGFINQQKELSPETYQRLSEEFMQSLQSSLEMYEDFDLVLDLRRPTLPSSISVTGKALGENRTGNEHVHAGTRALRYVPGPEIREIALVGSGDLAVEVLLSLSDWLKGPGNRLFVVSSEDDPFASFLKEAREEIKVSFHELMDFVEKDFQNEADDFHRKLREWQKLDDFVQAKRPRPTGPIPRLVFFSGHNVTAIDQLIDRRRLFVTMEKPEWRQGLRQPENNQLDLKTIGVDEVISCNGLYRSPVGAFLRPSEIGHFAHCPVRPGHKNAWKEDLNALDSIEKDIFKLFSPTTAQ